MDYINEFSDDYVSDQYQYNDGSQFNDISNQYGINDAVLNELIRLSKNNNITALRQYINIHRSALDAYKTRMLNNLIPLDGYKFVRREGKLIIIKFKNAMKHSVSEVDASTSNANTMNEADMHTSEVCSEITTPTSNARSARTSNEVNTITPTSINDGEVLDEAKSTQSIDSVLYDKQTSSNLELLERKDANSQVKPIESEANPIMTNLLNSLLQQANERSEIQKKQYEQLASTLNESISAKNSAEQVRNSRLNTVVDTIEKTFSAGTFDRIVESNVKLAEVLTSKHNDELDSLHSSINMLYNLQERTSSDVNTLEERLDNIEERIDELDVPDDAVSERLDKLEAGVTSTIKQHAELITACINLLFNVVDNDVFKQCFPNVKTTVTCTTD